jgi:ABC-type Zn uptake system ZnuABC Zn-binding protein ZnuA
MYKIWVLLLAGMLLLTACASTAGPASGRRALAAESFLADIARNVAGERMMVDSLIPLGLDPHSFEPTPSDAARIADSRVLIVNGAGFEAWLDKILQNAGGQRLVIEASGGLPGRKPAANEPPRDPDHPGDPHFWLDPLKVVHYTENIRDGLTQADPPGKEIYARNAEIYVARLKELDGWIAAQVTQIPPERRLLVTNHESLGYFADRYGFRVVGAVIPSVSAGASPSAQQLAGLIDAIRKSGAPAVFLETGSSPQLAEQVGRETGAKVVSGLYTHSVTAPDGPAPTYIDMMKRNVEMIVAALK